MSEQTFYLMMNDRRLWWLLWVLLLLLAIVALILPVPTTASPMAVGGTGPGGVGATTGSDTLELWLQSDKLVYSDDGCTTPQLTDGGLVGCWRDYSGNNNHAVQSNTASQPTFQNGSGDTLNSHPMLRWDGINDILTTGGNVTLGPLTIFIVYNASAHGYLYMHSPRSPALADGSYVYTDFGASYSVRRSGSEGYEDLPGDWGLSSNARIVVHHFNGTVATHSLYVNGALQTPTSTGPNSPGVSPTSNIFSIGSRSSDGALPITGNFAEVIVYNDYLNSAQRVIVENYLQAKFNDNTINNMMITNDRYDGDSTDEGDFDLDVAGIGQEADGSHTRAHSAGMIVEDDGFLQDNGDYLLFGHRTPVNDNVTTELPPTGDWPTAPNPQRWERHWFVEVTDVSGNAGEVTIIFDFAEGGMDPSEGPAGVVTNYRLLGRSGHTGNFTDVATATGMNSTQVIFENVSVTLLGSNFTLGTLDATTSPTAISLQTAAASPLSSLWLPTMLVMLLLTASTWVRLRRRGYENVGY